MSTEQEDAAMLLELNEKITHRIREQVAICVQGYESDLTLDPLDATAMRLKVSQEIAFALLNNPSFITNITKAVIQKLSSTYIS